MNSPDASTDDRVWLYHSDAGIIYYWDRGPDGWGRRDWNREQPGGIGPPAFVLPHYAHAVGDGQP